MALPLRFVPAVVPDERDRGDANWFAFRGNDLLVFDGERMTVPTRASLTRLGLAPVRTQYIGLLDDVPCFAVELPAGTIAPEGHSFRTLFEIYGRGDALLLEVAGTGFEILYWDRTHQFCMTCASPLEPSATERAKNCSKCGVQYFPRVSPCAIVLVYDGPNILMTRQARFPPGMYGLVAGFTESGETLERCAAREVKEETGIEIDSIEYAGSQPWPFPHQIMVGFTARKSGGTLSVDTRELEDARWFHADSMPKLPPGISIARVLIERWLKENASTSPSR